MTPTDTTPTIPEPADVGGARAPRRGAGTVLWLPGLAVAVGAAIATAHGLFEVARAAGTPAVISGLYPLITDGLALVAYTATARLVDRARRYAWTVVVLAASLSGLAQASYLAHGAVTASTALRFGIGAWPAIAAAVVAHLLYLITHTQPDRTPSISDTPSVSAAPAAAATADPDAASANETAEYDHDALATAPVVSAGLDAVAVPPPSGVQPAHAVQASAGVQQVVQTGDHPRVQPAVSNREPDSVHEPAHRDRLDTRTERDGSAASGAEPVAGGGLRAGRARAVARRHADHHGSLPTVRELMTLADVSRGTAATALKQLRDQPPALHVVNSTDPTGTH